MSIGKGVTTVHASGTEQDLNSTSTSLDVPIWKPTNVNRFGFVVDGSTATGTDLEVALVHTPAYGESTETVATLTLDATVSQGEGVYMDLTERVEANPGGQLSVSVSTAGASSSTGVLFLEGVEYPFQHTSGDPDEDRLGNMTEVEA